jgi:class 3 adenylate cyclase
MTPTPTVRYARSGDVNVAYEVVGDGPFDLVHVPGSVSNIELAWGVPPIAEFSRQLASFSRLIQFDKRGTGMSDRNVGMPDLETRMDDVRAVLDAAGSTRAALLGPSEGGPMSVLFAATYPERTWALVLFSTFPRVAWAPDFTWGETPEQLRRQSDDRRRTSADPQLMEPFLDLLLPGADMETRRAFAALIRQGASPGAVEALERMNAQIDVREALSAIRVPTLVMVRADDDPFNVRGSRYLAEHIPGAQYVEFEGSAHPIWAGDQRPVLEQLEPFLADAWERRAWEEEPDRLLATVLFTDLVDSTAAAVEVGDRRWRDVLSQHNATIRAELARFRGVELDTAGDGFFARFDGPARAIRCAWAIREALRPLDLEVRIGLHTGECELLDGKVAGIAVSIGARIAARANAGEVLVSQTVRDLVAGSGIEFEDRGVQELKSVPGDWRLYAVAQP